MADSFVENYKSKHRHPLNKLSPSIGIPMIVGPCWLVRRAEPRKLSDCAGNHNRSKRWFLRLIYSLR